MAKDQPRNIGDYNIQEELGNGSIGVVYKAAHLSTNRVVAVKILHSELTEQDGSRERFQAEAKTLVELTHANVVQTIDSGEQEGRPFLVTEYIEGKTLASLLRNRRLSLHESLAIIRHVCQGMWTAHSKGIVHHGLNSRNILVSEDLSMVKIADLGISKTEEDLDHLNTLSTSQTFSGSLHYMAPEQATDDPKVDQRTNVYSVGVLFYEMLTGKVPLGRFNLPSSINGEVPSDFDTIVLKCLASDPADRYATIGRLLKDIFDTEDRLNLNIVRDLQGLSRSTSKILSRGTATLRKKKLVAAGVTLLAVALALGIFAWQSMDRNGKTPEVAQPVEAQSEGLVEPDPPKVAPEPTESFPEAEDSGASELEPAALVESVPSQTPVVAAKPAVKPPQFPESDSEAAQSDTETAIANPVAEEYRIARSKYDAKLYGPALADLRSIQKSYPNSPETLAAYFLTAEIHEVAGNIEEAMGTYVEIQTRYPNDVRLAETTYRLGRLLLRTDAKDRSSRAVEIFERVVADYPASSWAPRALRAKAEIERLSKLRFDDPELGPKVPAEVFTYRQLLNSYPDDEGAEEALWRLGEAYEKIKRFELSAQAFSKLARRFPQTHHDASWKAAQLYDRKLDDKDNAISSYSQVPETSEHYRDAQKKLQKLKG